MTEPDAALRALALEMRRDYGQIVNRSDRENLATLIDALLYRLERAEARIAALRIGVKYRNDPAEVIAEDDRRAADDHK